MTRLNAVLAVLIFQLFSRHPQEVPRGMQNFSNSLDKTQQGKDNLRQKSHTVLLTVWCCAEVSSRWALISCGIHGYHSLISGFLVSTWIAWLHYGAGQCFRLKLQRFCSRSHEIYDPGWITFTELLYCKSVVLMVLSTIPGDSAQHTGQLIGFKWGLY